VAGRGVRRVQTPSEPSITKSRALRDVPTSERHWSWLDTRTIMRLARDEDVHVHRETPAQHLAGQRSGPERMRRVMSLHSWVTRQRQTL
jgi:hypothetical protein